MNKKKEKSDIQAVRPLELKKHVAVIHSSNKISLLQRKIANALLYNAYDNLQKQDEHEIHIGALCRLIGYASNDHRTIKNSLVNLLSTVIEWNLIDGEKLDSEGIWNASSIIADASINGSICTYSYSSKMKKLLYRPQMYGRLDMQVQAKFQSTYGLALYENCNRYQDIGQTPWFDLATFRKLMGVEENKYKVFRDFKHRVLDKAVEEVNKYSPINIDPQLRKQNRQVIGIHFQIKQSCITVDDIISLPKKDELSILLKRTFGFSKKQIENTLTNYNEEYIREKMIVVQTSTSFKNGTIKNLGNYLLCALKDDYQMQKNVITREDMESKPPKQYQLFIKHEDNDKRKLLDEHRRYQQKEIFKFFNDLNKTSKNKIIKSFEKEIQKSIYVDIYLREGLNNILIQDYLVRFLIQTKHSILQKVLTFENWLDMRQKLE